MKQKYIAKSLRTFPFSNDNLTPKEALFKSTLNEWYEAKHRTISNEEVNFINSVRINKCPYCGFTFIVKNGHRKDGIQKYKCTSCNRRFIPITNTIFDIYLSFTLLKQVPMIIEIQILPVLIGFLRYLKFLKIFKKMLFLKGKYFLMKRILLKSKVATL